VVLAVWVVLAALVPQLMPVVVMEQEAELLKPVPVMVVWVELVELVELVPACHPCPALLVVVG
jgi:hypothetical protein